jgi:hypothetical protein
MFIPLSGNILFKLSQYIINTCDEHSIKSSTYGIYEVLNFPFDVGIEYLLCLLISTWRFHLWRRESHISSINLAMRQFGCGPEPDAGPNDIGLEGSKTVNTFASMLGG